MTVLQEFYGASPKSFAQVDESLDDSAAPAPPTHEGAYQKKDASGVLGILEISMSDFARLETETKTAEAQAEAEYQKLMKGSAVRKATLNKDLEYKQVEKHTPSCTNTADSHDVRKERREAEIKSLQDALA